MTKRAASTPSSNNGSKRTAFEVPNSLRDLSSISKSLARQADGLLAKNGSPSVSEIIRRAQALSNSPPPVPAPNQSNQIDTQLKFKAPSRPLKFISSTGDPSTNQVIRLPTQPPTTSDAGSSLPQESSSQPPSLPHEIPSRPSNFLASTRPQPATQLRSQGTPAGPSSFSKPAEPLILSTDSARIAALAAQKRAENAMKGNTARLIEAQRAHQIGGKPNLQAGTSSVMHMRTMNNPQLNSNAPLIRKHTVTSIPYAQGSTDVPIHSVRSASSQISAAVSSLRRPPAATNTPSKALISAPTQSTSTSQGTSQTMPMNGQPNTASLAENASDAEGEAEDDSNHDSLFSSPSPLEVSPISASSSTPNDNAAAARNNPPANPASHGKGQPPTPAATPIPPLFSMNPQLQVAQQQTSKPANVPFGPSISNASRTQQPQAQKPSDVPFGPSPPQANPSFRVYPQQVPPHVVQSQNSRFFPSPPQSESARLLEQSRMERQAPMPGYYKINARLWALQPPTVSTEDPLYSTFYSDTPHNLPPFGTVRAGDLTGLSSTSGYNSWAIQNLVTQPWKNATVNSMNVDKEKQRGSFGLNKHCN